jgi:metal-responsive CopG/Arc/MetJ family transcriptional regulator
MAEQERVFNKELRFMVDEQMLRDLDAEAGRRGVKRNEMCRRLLEEKLSEEDALRGIDTIMKMLRTVLKDTANPQFERLAKMIAKDTKASATGMFMQVADFYKRGEDHVAIYDESSKKAAAYLIAREEN